MLAKIKKKEILTFVGLFFNIIFRWVSVPGEPRDVKVFPINSTSIQVMWKPPADRERNGVIRGYHVHVQETRDEVMIFKKTIFVFNNVRRLL